MARSATDGAAIEVVYEGGVFRPLSPVEGISEHERATVVLSPRGGQGRLADLDWSLTPEEADAMAKAVESEFEKVEGDW
ncbi:MAG: antitoxin family protein [Deltaproteobacteria bacterium]|nr:antitoxin family protein [Deltaproteobacteria bacterium]